MSTEQNRPHITRETLLQIMERFVKDECFTIMRTKGKDYENDAGDPFASLKANAKRSGVTPQVALSVLMNKHLDAISTYMRKGFLNSEPIEERIADAVNHLLLLYGFYVSEGIIPIPRDVVVEQRTATDLTEDDLYP